MKQKFTKLKGKYRPTVIVVDLIFILNNARITRQKINKEIVNIYNIINQLDLIDTYGTFCPM